MSRYSLTIDHTKVPSSLTDFPVYVNLKDIIPGMTLAQANSIRVYKADGVTEVPREIVSENEMHFLADSLSSSSDTTFVVDIDGARSDYSATDTYGSQAVWSNGFVGVWHLDNMTDSSSNSQDGSDTGTGVVAGTGQLGQGMVFDGSSHITLGNVSTSNPLCLASSSGTISAWVKSNSGTNYQRIIDKSDGASAKDGYAMWYPNGNNVVYVSIDSNSATFNANAPTTTWWYLGSTFVSSGHNVFFANTTTYNWAAYVPPSVTTDIGIGGWNTDESRNWIGTIDEVRVANTARSADWIATEYANQNSPSTFYSLSELRYSVQGIASIQGVTSIVL